MMRLAGYLVRLFAADALALFGIAFLLLYLTQTLRAFDVIAVKGQDLLTLIGQSFLTMPTLAIGFSSVCIAIGLARGLRSLHQSQELHVIHSSRRLPALVGGLTTYSLGGMVLVLLLTHIVEPTTRRHYDSWVASVAADLVSRTLTPHRFVQVTPGVTLVIGSRGLNGELGSFFADDRRNPALRQTYSAESATVAADGDGYVIRLANGRIQYLTDDNRFLEISFASYDLAVERLTGSATGSSGASGLTSIELIANAIARGRIDAATSEQLGARTGEGIRVLALCLMVAALAAFPHGRRDNREFPIEITVLGIAFLERLITSFISLPTFGVPSGSIVVLLGALVIFGLRAARPMMAAPARIAP